MQAGEANRRFQGVRGPTSSITSQREAQLRKLLARQPLISLRQIARAMGKAVSHQTIKTWCKHLGLPYRRIRGGPTKLTPEIEKRLRALIAERPLAGYKELARALQKPVQTVTDWVRRLGLPLRLTTALHKIDAEP